MPVTAFVVLLWSRTVTATLLPLLSTLILDFPNVDCCPVPLFLHPFNACAAVTTFTSQSIVISLIAATEASD